MMKFLKSAITFLILFAPFLLSAQNGTVRGQIIDGENGEPLFSANAVLKGTQIGATTDFDGNFELNAPAGIYTIEYSFIGMSSLLVTEVKVVAGEITVLDAVKLPPRR
jgi:hypothetical protein